MTVVSAPILPWVLNENPALGSGIGYCRGGGIDGMGRGGAVDWRQSQVKRKSNQKRDPRQIKEKRATPLFSTGLVLESFVDQRYV